MGPRDETVRISHELGHPGGGDETLQLGRPSFVQLPASLGHHGAVGVRIPAENGVTLEVDQFGDVGHRFGRHRLLLFLTSPVRTQQLRRPVHLDQTARYQGEPAAL